MDDTASVIPSDGVCSHTRKRALSETRTEIVVLCAHQAMHCETEGCSIIINIYIFP